MPSVSDVDLSLSRSHRIDVLDDDGIAAICTDDCRASMESLRSKIQEDCNPVTDLLDHGLMLFPGSKPFAYRDWTY